MIPDPWNPVQFGQIHRLQDDFGSLESLHTLRAHRRAAEEDDGQEMPEVRCVSPQFGRSLFCGHKHETAMCG